jgi:hypothetical protein
MQVAQEIQQELVIQAVTEVLVESEIQAEQVIVAEMPALLY